ITAGGSHSCALTSAGGVACWGRNVSGELGDGTTTNRLTPAAVVGLSGGVSAIAAGNAHTCALTSRAGVSCWGDNAEGQLGDATTTNRSQPVAVTGLPSGIAAIVAGDVHTCALTSDGNVMCWGNNFAGQLGDGSVSRRSTPVAVSGLSAVIGLAAGSYHTC